MVMQASTGSVTLLISAMAANAQGREAHYAAHHARLTETARANGPSWHMTHQQTLNRMPDSVELL